MSKREEEADAHGALALLKQLAGRVVDGRDVVGIERVAEAEAIREAPEAEERGILAGDREEQPPAQRMDEQHGAIEAAQTGTLAAIEAAHRRLHPRSHRSSSRCPSPPTQRAYLAGGARELQVPLYVPAIDCTRGGAIDGCCPLVASGKH